MKIWRFENFMELVRAGSISAAAERLHISPQALHQQMDTLEQEVGCKLLVRSRKGVRLTRAGGVFYNRIGVLVKDYRHLIEETLEEDQREHNTVRTASSGLFSDNLFMDALIEFKKQHPDILPTLIHTEHADSDACEVLINNLVYPTDSYALYSSVRIHCFVHVEDTHPLARRKRIHLEDLFGETVLVDNPQLLDQLQLSFWTKIRENASRLNVQPLSLQNSSAGDAMICSTHGVYLSWGPQMNLHPRIRQIMIEDSEFEYMMLYNKERFRKSEATRTYLEFIGQYYQKHWREEYAKVLG